MNDDKEAVFADKKSINDSNEPLTLRPPVGAEVVGFSGLKFRSLFGRTDGTRTRRRVLQHCAISALLLFILLSVLLVVLLFLGVKPLSDANALRLTRRSMCMVSVPQAPFSLTEWISAQDNMFNVTLEGPLERFDVLHICSEGLTVVRTAERCYIRPISEEKRRACMGDYMKLVQDGSRLRKLVRANQVNEEVWFAKRLTTVPELIQNSLIMEFCAGLPALRLVSQPPPNGYVIDSVKEEPELSEITTQRPMEDDDVDFWGSFPGGSINVRVRRSAGEKNNNPSVDEAKPVHCRDEGSFFEDPIISLDSESDEIRITKDIILDCE